MYAADPNIYEIDAKDFDKVVSNSNYTSIVKYYAPWCGYCKQIEPVYHKLGRYLQKEAKYGVNVVSINCDEASNKPFCQLQHVKGFPTLVVYRPPKYKAGGERTGKHVPEVYNGERSISAMVEYVTSRMKNYVKKFHNLQSETLTSWLKQDTKNPRVLLLSPAKNIPPLYKTMAIDFLGQISFGMVSVDKSQETVQVAGEEYAYKGSSLLLLEKDGKFIKFDDKKLKDKEKIEKWLSENTGIRPTEGTLLKVDKKVKKRLRRAVKDEL